ncbi:MAG: type II toxin-antitoxin system VapC family toxin [bacterium]
MPVWIYFDASALIKRYVTEPGTPFLNQAFEETPPPYRLCLVLGFLEVVSILVRKKNDRRINQDAFEQAMTEVWSEVMEDDGFTIDSADDALLMSSVALIEKHNLNATDAIVLRSAQKVRDRLLEIGEDNKLLLLTADKRLVRAAGAEGLLVSDPEIDRWPPPSLFGVA